MKISIKYLEAFKFLDIHLLLNNSIEECYFHIHLVDITHHLCSQSKDWHDGWVPWYKRKGILIVNPLKLRVPLGHKFGLVLFYASLYWMLYLEYPYQTQKWFVRRYWDLLSPELYKHRNKAQDGGCHYDPRSLCSSCLPTTSYGG